MQKVNEQSINGMRYGAWCLVSAMSRRYEHQDDAVSLVRHKCGQVRVAPDVNYY
jgi:hypothetical protein